METEITAIVVEDCEGQHMILQAFLRDVAPGIRIVGNAVSLKQAEELIKTLSPMLLFLDIQFDDEKETGFDLLHKLSRQGKLDFQVIIMTAFCCQEYYAEAFDLGVLHFLTKPFDKQKLYDAVMRARININHVKLSQRPTTFRHYSNNLDKLTIDGAHFTKWCQ